MKIDIVVPSVGESITEAVLAEWYKKDGDSVARDEPLFVIETDKVTLEVVAEADGVLHISVAEGESVAIGAVVGTLDSAGAAVTSTPSEQKETPEPPPPEKGGAVEAAPPVAPPEAEREPAVVPDASAAAINLLSPSVRRLVALKHVDISQVSGTGPDMRITKGDVLAYLESRGADPIPAAERPAVAVPAGSSETETRKPMTPIRRRIAARLLEAKNNTAMLTTFNEIDMGRVMSIRSTLKEAFKDRYQVSLGFMSFFIKASVLALKEFPAINAFIEGDDVVYHNYYHVGVAIGSPRGLVVPVIRHVDQLGFAELEQAIVDYVGKIKENRLELADMEGGTFTITNGGVFGSLLSTPILNTPQSGILGMHKIEKRPVVVNDEIVVRPIMYVALSYDHRIVDGREAVTFLRRIKECIENPERIMMEI
jgi:2-oxoglutarate dehydrogenase E2 component (dihydrolipoamide succinyltransferase)